MYLQTAIGKIQQKHGGKTEAYVKFYENPTGYAVSVGRELRLDQTASELYRDYYTAYCLTERRAPLEARTFRLSEPMSSPTGECTMYRIYQERFDGFHQIALVTVFNKHKYNNFDWKMKEIEENSKNTHEKPWWLWKNS